VELLERVVRQHDSSDLVGNPEQESVTPAYRPRRRANDLCPGFSLFEKLSLLRRDAVAERGVHDDRDNVVWVLNEELAYRLIELFECRQRTACRRRLRDELAFFSCIVIQTVPPPNRFASRLLAVQRPFGAVGTMPLPAHRHREMETNVSYAVQVGQQ
jgi:hypothetical protein